jgi:hypothetical protein
MPAYSQGSVLPAASVIPPVFFFFSLHLKGMLPGIDLWISAAGLTRIMCSGGITGKKTPESETGEWWVKHNNKMWYGPDHETRGQPEAAPLLPPPPLPPPLLPRMAPLRPRSHSRGLASNETHCAGVRNVGLVEASLGSARRRCRERRLGSRPMASAYREGTTSGTAGGSAGGGKSGGKTGGEGVGKAGGKAIGDTRHVLGDSRSTEMGPQNITNNRVSPLAAEDPKQLL